MSPPKQTDTPRQKPFSPEAERSVLGAMLISKRAIGRAIEILGSGEYFYRRSHRLMYETITSLFDKDEEVDAVTLAEELEARDQLEVVGGSNYIAETINAVPTPAHVEEYARIVKKKYMHRALIETCTEIIEMSYNQSEDVDDLLDRAEQRIFSVKRDQVNQGMESIGEVIKQTFDEIEEAAKQDDVISGTRTGFTQFDTMTSGLQENQFLILAGRPGMGKTSLALNIMQNVAMDEDEVVAMFSLEMSKMALVKRLLASESRISFSSLNDGKISDSDLKRLSNAMFRLGNAPIFLDDNASLNVLQMKAKTRRLKAEQDLSLVIVDYLQLMSGVGASESREQELAHISRGLKQMAMELQIPVLALTQLNRQVENRGGDKRPKLSDLRGSGAIEQDADLVGFVYRPFVYTQDEADRGHAELIIGKQRNGPTGTVELQFIDEYMRFENQSRQPEPAGF